ncbi:EamA family transporter [Actinomadura yumaensis]|uniref:EamA family transporter n=1 Tax=Actinomadura yumaensis TaxID=111807 RepID=UPI0036096481
MALVGQVGGLMLTLCVAPWVPASAGAADLGWGALSGVGTGVGMVFLYRGLSRGAMSVVVPVSAVSGVALPVAVGVVLLGDRPSVPAWVGIAVTVPALWLVSRSGSSADSAAGAVPDPGPGSTPGAGAGAGTSPGARTAAGGGSGSGRADSGSGTGSGSGRVGSGWGGAVSGDALVAGVGIALQYLALAQAGPDAGIWPVAAGRVAAIVTVLPLVAGRRRVRLPPVRTVVAAGFTGAVAACALVFYLLAVREQLAVVAIVLSSLYPAIPVLLGVTVLRERIAVAQAVGLAGAAAAIGLLTVG